MRKIDQFQFTYALALVLIVGSFACQPAAEEPPQTTAQVTRPGSSTAAERPLEKDEPATYTQGEKPMEVKVTSTAFSQGKPIPKQYTGEGQDISPPISWSNLPEGTKELALICDDPDAPTDEPWVHWVIYKIPADTEKLPEGIPNAPRLQQPPGALQGENSFESGQTIGYRGPMPPPGHGVHHYYFTLHALDTMLTAEPGLTKNALLEEMEGHVLGKGQLMGTYQR